jgi:hypothetical protein
MDFVVRVPQRSPRGRHVQKSPISIHVAPDAYRNRRSLYASSARPSLSAIAAALRESFRGLGVSRRAAKHPKLAADGLVSKRRLGRSSYYLNVALTGVLIRAERDV